MKSEKGILGKLLSIVGAVLVVVGVFVFQGASHADDATDPADAGGVGLTAGVEGADANNIETGTTDEEGAEVPSEGTETPADPAAPEYSYTVKYYKENGTEEPELFLNDSYAGAEAEHTFVITNLAPTGAGEFLAWYDEVGEKYYSAGDEVVLNVEQPELKLLARFTILRSYAMEYDANGGSGAPNAQSCETFLDTCDFTISNVVPVKEGYEFKGWQKEGDDTITYAPGASIRGRSTVEALKLKAVWSEIRTYTLIYEGNGGSGAPEVQVCKSADGFCNFIVSDAMPTRPSFEFIDWQKGAESVGPSVEITVTESVTILVANWNPVAIFTLEYVADDAKDIPEPQKCESSMGSCIFIVPEKEPSREGYRFKGWRWEDKEDMLAKAGDELIVGTDGPLTLRIFAVWSKIYSVLNSGEVFGAGERVVLRSAANYEDFKEFTIDTELVPDEYFTVNEGGGTSVLLSNAFAQALSPGEHAFMVTWKDGEANGIISVNQSEDGTKRFVIVDAKGNTDAASLMLRPKAGAVSKESLGTGVVDSAKDNGESNFDAMRTLIVIAAAAFVIVYVVNRFYIRHKTEFIENFK